MLLIFHRDLFLSPRPADPGNSPGTRGYGCLYIS